MCLARSGNEVDPGTVTGQTVHMRCTAEDLPAFAAGTGGWLRREPVPHNVILTIMRERLDGDLPLTGAERWVRVDDGGVLVGAAVRTPPHGPVLADVAEPAARALADFFAADDPHLDQVNGLIRPVEHFARRYAEATGRTPRPGMNQRVFCLDTVIPPRGVPGAARPATAADRALLIEWADAFAAEAAPDRPHTGSAAPVDARLRHDRLVWLWQVDGEPVSTAWLTRPVAGVVRVSGVYTPPARRGHGYASGCVAAASQHALDAGADACMLYTDLANPTSNKIYQALGYRPVVDAGQWHFDQ